MFKSYRKKWQRTSLNSISEGRTVVQHRWYIVLACCILYKDTFNCPFTIYIGWQVINSNVLIFIYIHLVLWFCNLLSPGNSTIPYVEYISNTKLQYLVLRLIFGKSSVCLKTQICFIKSSILIVFTSCELGHLLQFTPFPYKNVCQHPTLGICPESRVFRSMKSTY